MLGRCIGLEDVSSLTDCQASTSQCSRVPLCDDLVDFTFAGWSLEDEKNRNKLERDRNRSKQGLDTSLVGHNSNKCFYKCAQIDVPVAVTRTNHER